MITVSLDGSAQVQQQLLRLLERTGDLSPLMDDIGEHLTNSTHDNFETSTSPDGDAWASNSEATFAAMLGRSDTTKKGRINKRGSKKIMSKRPLIMSHTLMQSIHYESASTQVTVGTNMVYGAMMHYGGNKEEFPHLWGDIPARPYLGLSEVDVTVVRHMIREYIL